MGIEPKKITLPCTVKKIRAVKYGKIGIFYLEIHENHIFGNILTSNLSKKKILVPKDAELK